MTYDELVEVVEIQHETLKELVNTAESQGRANAAVARALENLLELTTVLAERVNTLERLVLA